MDNNIAIDSNLYLTHNETFCDYSEDEEDNLHVESDGEQDIYEQLAQKEKYLLIAAEAGKALLEKNEELREKLAAMQGEYQNRMDVLEQDKFYLKKQINQREEHYDSTIQDLQNEVQNLGLKLKGVQKVSQTFEKSQKENIEEIMVQNEALSSQLQQMSSHNQQLSFQVSTLKKRVEGNAAIAAAATTKIEEQKDSAEVKSLRKKIMDLEQHNKFLEESIGELEMDKESLASLYKKANEDNVVLVQKLTEADHQLSACQHELHESKSSNCTMKDQLDEYMVQASMSELTNNSLFNELKETSMSETDLSLCTRLQGQSPGKPMAQSSAYSLQTLKRPRPLSTEIMEDEDGEFLLPGGILSTDSDVMRHSNLEHEKLLDELQEAYQKIMGICQDLSSTGYSSQEEQDSTSVMSKEEIFRSGQLLCAVDVLSKSLQGSKLLVSSLQNSPQLPRSDVSSSGCHDDGSDGYSVASDSQASQLEAYEQQITELNSRLNETIKEWQVAKKDGALLLLEAKEKDNEINQLARKATFFEKELRSLREERELLLADVSDDSKLKRAVEDRKEAISRENNLSLEMQQLKYDMMKLNDQLLEAVQQKFELSEQLEQWQVDMASMIEKQLASKMKGESKKSIRKHRKSIFAGKWGWAMSPIGRQSNQSPSERKETGSTQKSKQEVVT